MDQRVSVDYHPMETARAFMLAWPKVPAGQHPRVCTYVRRNILESNMVYSSRDVLTIYIRVNEESPRIYVHSGLTKHLSSVLFQMRTGKIRLGSYLHSIRVNDTDVCQCGEAPQTVAHVLMDCPRYDALREETWEGRENVPRDLKGFFVDQRQVRRSAIFMVGTGLLRAPSSADSGVPAASGEGSQNPRTSVPSF